MNGLKRYLAILSAVIFLTASSGVHIIEHYCGACDTEDVAISHNHSDKHHAHGTPECNAQCKHKNRHQNHEQCDVKFFKVDEPFVNHEKKDIHVLPAAILHPSNVCLQALHLDHSEHINSKTPTGLKNESLIYQHCQLLI